MAYFGIVPFFIIFFCFLSSKSPSSFSTAQSDDLVTQVCKNTNDFTFCNDTVYSDTRAIYASYNRAIFAYIAIQKMLNSSYDTKDVYLNSEIKSLEANGGESDILQGFKNCFEKYRGVIERLCLMLTKLDALMNYDFDKLSLEIEGQVQDCENGFNGRSPMTMRNDNMVKLANIGYFVGLLFKD